MKRFSLWIAVLGLAQALTLLSPAQAGVFDLPGFVEGGQGSVGLEPEISISNETGAAFNFKPRYGVNDMLNIEGMIGTGAGARKFRAGVIADIEWFPDYENQPGIATALFMEYYRLRNDGLLMFGVKPLVYKTFEGAEAEYIPFIALPLGWNYRNSLITGFFQIAFGSMFKIPGQENIRLTGEAGFNIDDAYSYLSGGVTYYF